MHELSIAMNILEIVQDYTAKEGAQRVLELDLDIGTLSGIEIPALDFALNTLKPGSILEQSAIIIHEIEGNLKCKDCQIIYRANKIYEPCPNCMGFHSEIQSGKELQVNSILID